MENTILLYEEVATITSHMLTAAQQQDWEKLAELESNCAVYVDRLQSFNDQQPLTTEDYARKLASVKKILAHDREIRNLVAPWMVKLNAMLSTQSDRKSHRLQEH